MYITPATSGIQATNTAAAYSSAASRPSAEKEQSREIAGDRATEQPEPALKQSGCFADKCKTLFPRKSAPDNPYGSTSKPRDSAPQLTQRLVGAYTQFDVRTVLSEVNTQLVTLRIIAAIGKGEDAALAAAYVKKLEKLIGRARKKIQDLDNEDMLRLRKAKAERQKQKKRAEEIKEELCKKQMLRFMKERSYLLGNGTPGVAAVPDCRTEAAIAAQAEAIAAAEITGLSAGAADGGISADISASPGAEASAVGDSIEGGVDISV